MFHWILVLLQFVLAAFLVLSISWQPLPWRALGLASPGALLAVWAWFRMGLWSLRIHPTATQRTRLLRGGPYAVVRHPMYSGLLWFTAALILMDQPSSGFRWGIWGSLVLVLLIKSNVEEASMTDRYPEYADYQKDVGGLFPKLFRMGREES